MGLYFFRWDFVPLCKLWTWWSDDAIFETYTDIHIRIFNFVVIIPTSRNYWTSVKYSHLWRFHVYCILLVNFPFDVNCFSLTIGSFQFISTVTGILKTQGTTKWGSHISLTSRVVRCFCNIRVAVDVNSKLHCQRGIINIKWKIDKQNAINI